MLAWTPPEMAAAGIPIVPRTAECTISRNLADTEVFSARGRAMVDFGPTTSVVASRTSKQTKPYISMERE